MISDPSFHGATSIIMLNPKPHVRHQTPIILRNRTLNLLDHHHHHHHNQELTSQNKWENLKSKSKQEKSRRITLISLNGIKRLFSILESKPRIRAALRKLRLVAARAFIIKKEWNRRRRRKEKWKLWKNDKMESNWKDKREREWLNWEMRKRGVGWAKWVQVLQFRCQRCLVPPCHCTLASSHSTVTFLNFLLFLFTFISFYSFLEWNIIKSQNFLKLFPKIFFFFCYS